MVHAEFSEARGVDVEPDQLAACSRRLGDLPGVGFSLARALGSRDAAAWDVVTCMEVLEHCLEPERRRILGELARLCAPRGTIIISVPIETGPSVVAKQLVRAVAGLRGLGDYRHRERYSPAELLRAAGRRRVPRVVYEGRTVDGPFEYYGHKGFDWRDVRREAGERLRIDRVTFSPLPWAGAVLNSQVWFVGRPRS
jgi:SAM-dependent methyltransferase